MEKDIDVYDKYRELYDSIVKGDVVRVRKFYNDIQQDPPRNLTVHGDTMLHVAICMRHENVAREIFENHVRDPSSLLEPNVFGDTILHEAAGTNMTGFVTDLLRREPKLLSVANKNKEFPLFKAAYFGQTAMFQLLAKKVEEMEMKNPERAKLHLKSGIDKPTTVLHITILAEFFDLAHIIAKKYPELQQAKNEDGMTGLQLLSKNPSAFKSGSNLGFTKTLLYYCAPSTEDTDTRDGIASHEVDQHIIGDEPERPLLPSTCNTCIDFGCVVITGLRNIRKLAWNLFGQGWPMMENIWNEKKRHESALRLAKLLIRNDFSWNESTPKPDKLKISILKHEGQISADTESNKRESLTSEPKNDSKETPLLIATSNGIIEIVGEILDVYPQAVEHFSKFGRNILHVAIRHRQKKIFNLVKKMLIPLTLTRLARSIDDEDYTILHYVGVMDNYCVETMAGPALQLQDELIWFDMVQEIMPARYAMHRSKEHEETAEEFFKRTHKDLRKEAQDWLKRTCESCSTVAVLIAAAAFTAAYTVPGGPNDKGLPILLDDTFFLVFTIMDVLSLASSLTSVVMFLSILTSPHHIEDFRYNLPRKLVLGFTLLFFAVAVTMLAFAATILLIIDLKSRSSMLLVYMMAFLPVSIFAMLQFPLFAALMALTYSLNLIGKVFRRMFRLPTAYRNRID